MGGDDHRTALLSHTCSNAFEIVKAQYRLPLAINTLGSWCDHFSHYHLDRAVHLPSFTFNFAIFHGAIMALIIFKF